MMPIAQIAIKMLRDRLAHRLVVGIARVVLIDNVVKPLPRDILLRRLRGDSYRERILIAPNLRLNILHIRTRRDLPHKVRIAAGPQKLRRQIQIAQRRAQPDTRRKHPAPRCVHPMQQRLQLPPTLRANKRMNLVDNDIRQTRKQARDMRPTPHKQRLQ